MYLDNSIKQDYESDKERVHSFEEIKRLYEIMPKTKYHLDDQSFEDMDIKRVYEKIDKSYSSPGEAALYSLLRNISINEATLSKRGKIINYLQENISKRTKLHSIFYNLGFDNKNTLLNMLQQEIKVNKSKSYIYMFLGQILPIILILMGIYLRNPKFIIALAGILMFNAVGINAYEAKNINNNGLYYLKRVFTAAKEVTNIGSPELKGYTNTIKENLNALKAIDRAVAFLSLSNILGGLFETLSMPLLLSETVYYKISATLEKDKDVIFELYYLLGEIEALISIASYKDNLQEPYCRPVFTKEVTLDIKEGYHPLVDNPIKNSINIDKHGIILTGTNMSGKSTFLRMLGINIIFAQVFNFALAKSYKASLFNVVSSISPNDDVTVGKSYYMAEAESLLRIIKATEAPIPVFCAIDEIFRGTNPIERIASSAEILKYINSKNALCIVATHDRELTDILKNNYDFYYFSEAVDNSSGLSFDYKLKPGVSQSRNAIKLLDYLGYPKEIINASYNRARSIEGFI